MSALISYCEQRSDDWYRLRLGLPTMSEAPTILAKGKDGGVSLTRKKYLHRLAAERITGQSTESYTNVHMERGRQQEADARELYAFVHDVSPLLVGFITNEIAGCSPDALVGGDGLAEVKTRLPDLQIELLLADRPPPEHRAQVQGNLWVSEREWCDLIVYSPGLPLYVNRQYRDEDYIRTLAGAVERFNTEIAEIVERVRRYGQPPREVLREQLRGSL